jgi:hypothetical protein
MPTRPPTQHRNTPQHTATHRTPSSRTRRASRKSRKSADRGGTTSVLTKLDRVKHQAKKSLKTIQSNPFEFGVVALAAILAGQQLGAHLQEKFDVTASANKVLVDSYAAVENEGQLKPPPFTVSEEKFLKKVVAEVVATLERQPIANKNEPFWV